MGNVSLSSLIMLVTQLCVFNDPYSELVTLKEKKSTVLLDFSNIAYTSLDGRAFSPDYSITYLFSLANMIIFLGVNKIIILPRINEPHLKITRPYSTLILQSVPKIYCIET